MSRSFAMRKLNQKIKNFLVRQGPGSVLVHAALRLQARRQGFRIKFQNKQITLIRENRTVRLSYDQYVQVPWMMEFFDFFFETIEGEVSNGTQILDFSKPGLHRYVASGIMFHFPSIPEDDVMGIYTKEYEPKDGDVVWDVGAHAGATTYFLSQMVGSAGRVYAFEPDETNFQYLLKNIELHHLRNVVPVKRALAGATGMALFNMDGSMSAGLSDYLVYSDDRCNKVVSTVTFEDICSELGVVPKYVKMDIEGAEVDVIRAARVFLRNHSIHFAIESGHVVEDELTYAPLERLFIEAGYIPRSGTESGQIFTWAAPSSEASA